MKTRTLTLVVVLALAVVTPIVLVFLFPRAHVQGIETAVMLVVFSIGVILLAHALFQRVAQRGPWAEFWTTLLKAVGFIVIASPFIADVPVHSTLGMALTLGGIAVAFVGILWGARIHHDRSVAAR